MHSRKQDSRVGALRRISLRAWAVGAIFAAVSLHSNAAGLGRLDVKSVLGEPLRAEVSVLAKPGEIGSLEVRLAPPQAYQAAGLVHTLIVSKLAVTLTKDASGQPVVNITSAGPINEPVIDLLLELSWASGRVTREYTAFIDPPFIVAEREKRRVDAAVAAAAAEEAARGAETQAATAPTSPTPEALPEEPVADAATQESARAADEVADKGRAAPTQVGDLGPVETIGGTGPTLFGATPTLSSTGTTDEYAYSADNPIGVIRGDTLSKIALANKPAGVTLEQMLVVLFRNNQQAFSGKNMNRLRTGKIIRLADREEYDQISAADARKEVRVQSTNWEAYKERLAAATMQQDVSEQMPQQAAGGAVTPKIEEQTPAPSGTAPEVVKLSRGEPASAGSGTGQGNVAAMQEKLVASEKALKESNARVTRLEKIIEDLQKLAEVKNQDMAELQNQAGAATKPKPAPVPQQGTQPAKPQVGTVQPSQPTMPPAADQTIQPTPDTAAPAKPEKMDPQSAATGQTGMEAPANVPPGSTGETPKTTPQATQKPQRRPPPPPPPPPPSLLDQAFAQPYLVAIPLILILLVGWGVSRLRGRNREPKEHADESAPAFADSGGSSAPGTFSPVQTDVGLAGRGGAGGDEVDPLEEAEIFLAYGRDAQAEELLQEAIAAHPTRFEIHLKLLEIYARQGNVESFEKLARDIQKNSGSEGEIWDRVVKLGYSIDPGNPRYAEGAGDESERYDDNLSSTDMSATTERLDFDVGMGDRSDTGASTSTGTDIDLGANRDFEETQIMDTPTIDVSSQSAAIDSDLNLDLPTLDHGASALDLSVDDGGNAVDFDFDSDTIGGQSRASTASKDDSGLDFDINEMSFGAGSDEQGDSLGAPALDLSGISLDLDGATTNQMGASSKDDKWYEVQTKFDLAKAYQEMGDNDGAREILKEVISEGDPEQKAAAENVLSSLE